MFRRIEIRHYKCLKKVAVDLAPFNILIGPNASGKSTLLDALEFLKDALWGDVEEAVRKRAVSLSELVWKHQQVSEGFELALDAEIPETLRTNGYDRLRYVVGIGLDSSGSLSISGEHLWLSREFSIKESPVQLSFPREWDDSPIMPRRHQKTPPGWRVVVRKIPGGNDYFRSERTDWNITFRLPSLKLALSGVPEDPDRFPVTLWFRDLLRRSVQSLRLNSLLMRRPCPADAPRTFQPDGSNLPILVSSLLHEYPERFNWWLGHVQTVLEDVETVVVHERPEDRSQYLVIRYKNGLRVPSWMLSDGTLRFLALTLLAYLPPEKHVFLIEEPENGMHPLAIEAVFQSLSSVYEGQVFLATHSPLFIAVAQPSDLLIFGRTVEGATDVIRGNQHPKIWEWREGEEKERTIRLETLFAAGVL